LEEHEEGQVRMVAELKDAIRAGIMSGPGVLAEKVFDRLEKKYSAMGPRETNDFDWLKR
jgi:antitoxin ParD1/3/4